MLKEKRPFFLSFFFTLTPNVPLTYVSIVVLRTGRPQPIVPLTYVSIVELQTGWITSTPIVPLTYVSIVVLRTGIFLADCPTHVYFNSKYYGRRLFGRCQAARLPKLVSRMTIIFECLYSIIQGLNSSSLKMPSVLTGYLA